ncbi:transcriptional regulator [Edwardsiella tarda]|uniref:Transcriptional regulator n=1 Tax=Edwardsiella tarda TaxID=636 RepID=A0A2A7U2N4_EDWTA|nr:helix-turn-helix domain-containing protein [Edwardsiella tarda]PEH72625.1 transcriptional regulator [Edwardsiella tarda]
MNPIIKTAIKAVGTQKKLGAACGVSQSAVQKWLYNKSKVAPENVMPLVEATKGAVQAHEIRPDLPNLFPPPVDTKQPECLKRTT